MQFWITVLITLLTKETAGYGQVNSQVSSKLSLQILYNNPNNYARDGKCDYLFYDLNCDVYFKICIWNGEHFEPNVCDVASRRTATYQNQRSINIYDEEQISLSIKGRIPPRIRMQIEIMDQDKMTNDDNIATFVSDSIKVSSRNPSQLVPMRKTDGTQYTKDIRLSVYAKFECFPKYYGELCDTYCEPNRFSYFCASNGSRICYSGFRGELCEKTDFCAREPCAQHAVCSNLEDGTGRICVCNNGQGDDCYTVRDVCNPSPCKNEGICIKIGPHLQQFSCECQNYWHGPTCSEIYSSCDMTKRNLINEGNVGIEDEINVCSNGGSCIDSTTEFKHTCVCEQGWKGERCVDRDWTVEICVSFFVTLIFLIIIAILIYCYLKKTRRNTFISRFLKSIQPSSNDSANVYSESLVDEYKAESYIYPIDHFNPKNGASNLGERMYKYIKKNANLKEPCSTFSDESINNNVYGEISSSVKGIGEISDGYSNGFNKEYESLYYEK